MYWWKANRYLKHAIYYTTKPLCSHIFLDNNYNVMNTFRVKCFNVKCWSNNIILHNVPVYTINIGDIIYIYTANWCCGRCSNIINAIWFLGRVQVQQNMQHLLLLCVCSKNIRDVVEYLKIHSFKLNTTAVTKNNKHSKNIQNFFTNFTLLSRRGEGAQ